MRRGYFLRLYNHASRLWEEDTSWDSSILFYILSIDIRMWTNIDFFRSHGTWGWRPRVRRTGGRRSRSWRIWPVSDQQPARGAAAADTHNGPGEDDYHLHVNGYHPQVNGYPPHFNVYHPHFNDYHPLFIGYHPPCNGYYPHFNGYHPQISSSF